MSVLESTAHLKERKFDPRGIIKVRRAFELGDRVRTAGEPLDAVAEGLDERTLRVWWGLGMIDTTPAPSAQGRKRQ